MATSKGMKEKITRKAKSLGASLVNFAPAERWDEFGEVQPDYRPKALWDKVKTVIVIGVPMLLPVLESSQVINHLREKWPTAGSGRYQNSFAPAFVVGSSLDRELALEIGAPHLSVSFPVANWAVLDRGYTGFRGGLRLIEDLIGTVVAGR
jgi:hypothetical protein